MAGRHGRFEAGSPQRTGDGTGPDPHRPVLTAVERVARVGSLAALEERKQRVVVPPAGSGGLPGVIAGPVAAEMNHAVDPAGPAQYLSARPVENGVVGAGLRHRLVGPVDCR